MLIRKIGSKVVHLGFIPHNHYETYGKPTACGQSGWASCWVIVRKMRHTYRKCRKCFRNGGE